MNRFLSCAVVVFCALLAAGCDRGPSSASSGSPMTTDVQASTVEPRPVSESREKREAQEFVDKFLKRDAELARLTNIYLRPAGDPPQPKVEPRIETKDGLIDLVDLGLHMRPIKLDAPIGEVSKISFSDTEVTNQAYAVFLGDTNRFRDDSELEAASREPLLSTASPIIRVRDTKSLWRKGVIPAKRELYPVSFLTIRQATEFCDWLNHRYSLKGQFRLPTEAEWMFAAYGADRQYPWGNEQKKWTGTSTTVVTARPDLRTPDGLYGMWGNVSEFVISPWNGYGSRTDNPYRAVTCKWMGTTFEDEEIRGHKTTPRQDYWGYTHSLSSRNDDMGFRVVLIPKD